MTIYRVHQLRVLTAFVLLAATTVLLLVLNPPEKCVRVSVSVRQWRTAKRTHLVLQGLEDEDVPSPEAKEPRGVVNTAWFRTKIILPSPSEEDRGERGQEDDVDEDLEEDEEDEYGNDDANEYYDEDDLPQNKVFEEGDFDYNDTYRRDPDFGVIRRIFGAFQNSSDAERSGQQRTEWNLEDDSGGRKGWRNITLVNVEGIPIVENGIFWSEELERMTPKGTSDEEAESALKKLRSLKVQRVEPPTWNRCGRPKNQFVVFEDGSKACARYRAPHQYLVQGEVLSFYLSRLMGIHNVPAVSLAAVGPDFQGAWRRKAVKRDLIASKWEVNTTVALIQWIENLERDKMPSVLLSCLETGRTLSAKSSSLLTLVADRLTELLQWSDLILFDYVTGNYDRVASMQDAAEKEAKPSILRETVHNLVRSKSTGGLWLIDNESGLIDSYSLLYGGKDARFVAFHERMLGAICLFRRRTAERMRWLHRSGEAGRILARIVRQMEPLFTSPEKEEEVSRRLQQRIAEVYEHIERCRDSLS